MSCSHCKELGQLAVLASDWLFTHVWPITVGETKIWIRVENPAKADFFIDLIRINALRRGVTVLGKD